MKKTAKALMSIMLAALILASSFISVSAQSMTNTTEPLSEVSEEMQNAIPQETQTVNEEQLEETVEPQQAEPVGAEAEEAVGEEFTTSNGINYTVDNYTHEATITGYVGSSSSITFPATIDGYTVKKIGYQAFLGNETLKTVTISSGILEISGAAFGSCVNLQSISMPDSITYIGSTVFNGCLSLKSIVIPPKIETIKDDSFRNSGLRSIKIPNSVKTIEFNAFLNCENLVTASIGSGVESIGSNVFSQCTNLQTVSFASNNRLKKIGQHAFSLCSSLTGISIPNTVTEIGDNAFYKCTNLMSITIPNGVTKIGGSAFSECQSLKSVSIGSSVEEIGYFAFSQTGLKSVAIPDSVKTIKWDAFNSCKELETVSIGKSIEKMYDTVFANCSKLKKVTISPGAKTIGDYAFHSCSALSEISIPNSITEIGDGAFYQCTSLPSIAIPDSIKKIGSSTFSHCQSLENITIGSSVEEISENSFVCSGLKSVSIPNSVKTIGNSAFDECMSLETVSIGSGVNKMGKWVFTQCSNLRTVTIANGTTVIGISAFGTCQNLLSITIPESVTQIGNAKLNGSDLEDSGVFYNHSPSLVIYGKTGSFAESFANANGINFNNSQGGAIALANERLTIYQNENGQYKAAQDAKVVYNGQTFSADSYGVVAVPTISSGSITVSKSGYITRTLTSDQLKVSTKIYLEQSNSNAPTVLAVWVGNTDVLHDSYPLEMTSTATTKITAEIDWGNYSYGSIRLSQDGKTASFSGNTLSMVISNKFDTSKDITLIATDSQGRKTEEKLLIENGTVNNTLKSLNGTRFSFKDALNLTFPSDWPLIGGKSLGVGVSSIIPVTVSADNGKLYIAIGADIGSQSNTDSYATNAETGNRAHVLSDKTKSFIQKFKETGVFDSSSASTALKKLKNFKQTYKDAIKRPQGKFGVEADFTILGFAEGSFDENGVITWIDTGMIANPSVSVQHTIPFTPGPIPVPAFFEVGLSADVLGQLTIRLNEQAKNFVPNGEISGTLSVNGGLGLGVKNVFYCAGGLEGSLCPDWKINYHDKDSLSIKAKLDAYAKLGIAFLEFKKIWTLAETTVYDSSQKTGSSVGALPDDYNFYDYSNYVAKDLSYLDSDSKAGEAVGAAVEEAVGATQIKDNIYRESTPQLVTFSNGTKLAVWLDGASSDLNGICLYYSYYNGSSWSVPSKVYNDGTLDYAPQMVEANGKAYLVWQNATRTFARSDDLNSIAKDFDIAVAVFNGSTFNTTKLSNSNLDMQPVIYAEGSNAYVAWVNNSKNDWFGNNSYNSIYTSTYNGTWSQPQVKYSSLKSIGGLAIDYRNGIKVAYSVDTDGNIQTFDDLRVYENGSRVSANVQSFSPQYYQHNLYWYSGNTIVSSGTSNSGAIPSDRYQLVNANGTTAAVFTQSEGLYSKVCVSYYNTETNTWGSPRVLVDNHSAIGAFSASVNKNGNIEVLINNCPVTGTYSTKPYDGISSLLLFSDSKSCDISINDLFYDEKDISLNTKKEFEVEIANNGTNAIKGIDLTVTDDNGTVLSSAYINDMLVPGDTLTTSVSYDATGKVPTSKLTIKAVPRNSTDTYQSNNLKTISMVNDNVSVENVTNAVLANEKVSVSADIVNYGAQNSGTLTVRLRKGSVTGNIVATKYVSNINSLDLKTVSFEINGKVRNNYFVCIEGNVDSFSADNYDFIFINNTGVEFAIGDANLDGKVDIRDVTAIQRYLAHIITFSNDQSFVADTNSDGQITISDATEIQKYLAEFIEYFGQSESESISLNFTQLSMSIGEQKTLIPTIIPSTAVNTVTWISSNTTVATVSSGTVTAKSKGTAVITAKTVNGKTATCNITVNQMPTVITLDYSSKTLNVDDSFKLTATVSPSNADDKTVTWTSNNTTVATVSNGTVTAKLKGTAVITAKTVNGKTATCNVTVNQMPTGITLNYSSKTLNVGDSVKLTATISPSNADDKTVTWTSSNTTVATVSSGTVTAKSKGTAVITAKTVNGKTATCNITVNQMPTGITLDYSSKTLNVDDSFKLTATVSPSNADDKTVTWTSNNTTVATVSSGTVTAKSKGTAIITAKTVNGKTATCNITVNQMPTGITLDYSSKTLNVGDSVKLTATVSPSNADDKTVTWTSGNNAVATVSNGTVTAKAKGTTVVTAKTVNGKTATCNITVNQMPYEVLFGDLNEDGVISEADLSILSRYQANMGSLTKTQEILADVTGDGTISVADILCLSRVIEGLQTISEMPIYSKLQDSGTCGSNLKYLLKNDGTLVIFGAGTMSSNYSNLPWNTWKSSIISLLIIDGVTNITSSAFKEYTELNSITIPDSVTEIGYQAFGDCTKLETVNIGSGVSTMGSYAFDGCTALKTVTIASGTSVIGNDAFNGCISLNSISIPSTITSIGSYAFYNCTSLPRVTIPNSVQTIGSSAFYNCKSMTSLTIGSSVKTIGFAAFKKCESLTTVTIPSSVNKLDSHVFMDCAKLETVKIGGGVTSMGSEVFRDCTALKSVTIASGASEIGAHTFNGCISLNSISIPSTISSIGSHTFYSCTSLLSITIPNSVQTIGFNAFAYCESLTTVTIPDSVYEIGTQAFMECTKLETVNIGSGVTTMDTYAFRNCTALKTVTIASGTTTIGNSAFYGCNSLTRVDIPESVTIIGNVKLNDSDLKDSYVFYNHSSSLTIFGNSGSFAHQFANTNNIKFSGC